MKRIIPLMIVGALSVVGCGEKKQPATQNVPTELQSPQQLPPAVNTLPPAEPIAPPPAAAAPAPAPAPAKPAAKPTHHDKHATASATDKTSAKASAKTSGKTYTIKKGDTLGAIAKAHKTSVKKILAANPGLDPDRIIIGHKINLP